MSESLVAGQGVEAAGAARLAGLDAVRAFALLGVIYIHAPKIGAYGSLLDELARFAVPFFFVASGYFLAKGDQDFWPSIKRVTIRIGVPFLFWLVIYNLAGEFRRVQIDGWGGFWTFDHLMRLLKGGRGFHLWFLPALLFSSVLLILMRRAPAFVLMGVALILYAAALVFGSYGRLLFGEDLFWNIAHGPCAGLIMVAVGYLIARRSILLPLSGAILVMAAGAAMVIAEGHFLGYDALARKDYMLGTPIYGAGAFLVALSLPRFPGIGFAASIGRYGLGIFCIHYLVLHALVELEHPHTLIGVIAVCLVTFAISAAAVLVLAQIKPKAVLS